MTISRWKPNVTVAGIVETGGRFRSPWVLTCVDDYLAGQRVPLEWLCSI